MISTVVTWGPAALWAAVLFLLSASPDLPGSSLLDLFSFADKLVHAALYTLLGAALAWAGSRTGNRGGWALDVLLVTLGALYGASDEWHQSFVPGRDASGGDWIADLAGLGLGYLVVRRLRWRR